MITKKQAKEFAQTAWNTGTYLNDKNGTPYIMLPEHGCLVVWSIKKGEVRNVQTEQVASGI